MVEGATDRALLEGLRRRWCPGAIVEKIEFRGSRCRHRDYDKMCADARLRGVDALVILTDANGRKWRDVKDQELKALPGVQPFDILVGVCDRNVECWLCADPRHAASVVGCDPGAVDGEDPKSRFERALGVTRSEKQEDVIADLVQGAPLREWIRRSPSFRSFYEDARDIAQRRGCTMRNEEDRE